MIPLRGHADVKHRLLLVDDEPAILDGLQRQLRREFEIRTATSGAAGLQIVDDEEEPFAIIVSDMRMPGMNGAAFLAEARLRSPDTVRVLLTGQTDMQAAISAVNDGQIFRFLTKPCPPDTLRTVLQEGTEIFRLRRAEKDLLERTLHGAVRALTDTLALAHPKAYSRSLRIARTVGEIADVLEPPDRWVVDVAAMLAQLAAVSLPQAVLEKLDSGVPLNEEEREMVGRIPLAGREIIAAVPRLESVAEAVGLQHARYDGANLPRQKPHGDGLPLAARIIKVAVDFDYRTSRRLPAATVISQLQAEAGVYDPAVLDALAECYDVGQGATPMEVTIAELQPGMILLESVVSASGTILLGRGSAVTSVTVERLRNYVRAQGLTGAIVVSSNLRQ